MGEPTIWAKAKAELERRGWHQFSFADGSDPSKEVEDWPCCILGAINAVLNDGDPYNSSGLDDFEIQLVGHLDLDPLEVGAASWNDLPERTVEDVYRVLDELDAAERGDQP